ATVDKSSLSLQQPCPQGLSRSPCSSRRATPFLDSTRPLNNERTSSSLVSWIVSPPVTRETGVQFPDGERVPDLLSFFCPGLSRRKAKRRASCIGRESTPGLPRGKREFYHSTTNARHCTDRT